MKNDIGSIGRRFTELIKENPDKYVTNLIGEMTYGTLGYEGKKLSILLIIEDLLDELTFDMDGGETRLMLKNLFLLGINIKNDGVNITLENDGDKI